MRVVLDAPCAEAEAANVVGVLPGRRDDRPILVGGHHDGWFRAAFDDASAVAMTLALARSGLEPERPIVFISHTAEEYGIAHSSYDWCYGAWYQLVEEHRDWSTEARFYLNLEGAAAQAIRSRSTRHPSSQRGPEGCYAPLPGTAYCRMVTSSAAPRRGRRYGHSWPPASPG